VPWTRHQGIIAICQQYLETVETLERVTRERDEARLEVCKLEAKQVVTDMRERGMKRREIPSLEHFMEVDAWIKGWDLVQHFKVQNLPKHWYREDGSHIGLDKL
jgi:hypothetical protein